ncbi:MAG: VOC family protein [Aeromicrobium sp.]
MADDGVMLLTDDGAGFRIRLLPTDEPEVGPNRVHFDLTSTSLEDQQATVERALGLGGRHIDVGQLPEEGHVVLADPEGNEFCVVGPGNKFLVDTGFIGGLSCVTGCSRFATSGARRWAGRWSGTRTRRP